MTEVALVEEVKTGHLRSTWALQGVDEKMHLVTASEVRILVLMVFSLNQEQLFVCLQKDIEHQTDIVG